MNGRIIWVVLVLGLAGALGAIAYLVFWGKANTYEVEKTDYHPPHQEPEEVLVNDKVDDKKPPFDPDLTDSRPLGDKGEWLLNASAAVLRLDVPMLFPDREPHLVALHPSYAAAIKANPGHAILPSVNLIDGKAKQFDDGLYAALDQAYYQGLKNTFLSHVQLVQGFCDKAGKDNPAAPFLAAGLELAGVKVEVADKQAKERFLSEFQENEVASKPIGFYTWNETLKSCFRFLRFFQRQFGADELAVPNAVAALLSQDMLGYTNYQKANAFYARLTNPLICLSMADALGKTSLDAQQLAKRCEEKKVSHRTLAFFPPSTSREVVLFEKLFPQGLPANVDLMRELVKRIRSGEVDLKPGPDSGWYEYQVYALETLLLPEKGEERSKLLLTKAYKTRMLEAFKALVTKRRETHVRQLAMAEAGSALPPLQDKIKPRLRVEPCPSYFLRTARAYAFLANFLEATVGNEALQQLHGLKKEGARKENLFVELNEVRDLFYGLYLLSAEDIGMKATFAKEEHVQVDRCDQLATDWLAKAFQDEDLAADTRVAVPIMVDPNRKVTRLWLTLGVRLTKLETDYARPPSIKPAKGEGDWKVVESHQLDKANYLIPVDEFAEVEVKGLKVLTREELRAICDREKTKEAILQALRQ